MLATLSSKYCANNFSPDSQWKCKLVIQKYLHYSGLFALIFHKFENAYLHSSKTANANLRDRPTSLPESRHRSLDVDDQDSVRLCSVRPGHGLRLSRNFFLCSTYESSFRFNSHSWVEPSWTEPLESRFSTKKKAILPDSFMPFFGSDCSNLAQHERLADSFQALEFPQHDLRHWAARGD